MQLKLLTCDLYVLKCRCIKRNTIESNKLKASLNLEKEASRPKDSRKKKPINIRVNIDGTENEQ
jgi:hypothetical protein